MRQKIEWLRLRLRFAIIICVHGCTMYVVWVRVSRARALARERAFDRSDTKKTAITEH